jgi:transcription initiation factor TFIIF subunit alpha
MKREYQKANKHREAGVDEDEEEEEVPTADKSVKRMQKMIRSREGNNAYESEDEENPYASSVSSAARPHATFAKPLQAEEEEEEEQPAPAGPAIQPQVDSRSNTPKPVVNGGKPGAPPGSLSRATSPVASPGHGGHSLIAQRATSPKVLKPKTPGNRSPAASPPGSRATSPLAGTPSQKRKADDAGPPRPKKVKVEGSPPPLSREDLEKLLIEWLKNTPQATTRDCIQHFNSYLVVNSERKKEFSGMVKQVALLKNGFLALRPKPGT